MAGAPARRCRRRWWFVGLAVLAVVAVAGAGASWVVWRHYYQGQRMRIPGEVAGPLAPLPEPPPTRPARTGPPYVTSVSANGRYFLDQYGKPLLVKGDSPWALMTRLSPAQARLWFADRRRQGVNAAIVSLLGAVANGGPSDDGATFDGLEPFVDGDVLRWREPYWQRVTAYLRLAADHGITVMLYPIDGWTIDRSFVPRSVEQCRRYGGMVARRFGDLPNIVWMSGVLDAYGRQPAIPAVLGEANYQGENNQHQTPPTTDETLRRQVLWSLTSGAAGEFLGTHDWDLHQGWERRLSSPALTQITRLRALFSRLRWEALVPDTGSQLVTGGRGTELATDDPGDVLENDYATAARTPDGRLAVVYLPTRRTISVDPSAMAAGTRAAWVDPASGARRPVPMAARFTPPGPNAAGDNDWLLILTG